MKSESDDTCKETITVVVRVRPFTPGKCTRRKLTMATPCVEAISSLEESKDDDQSLQSYDTDTIQVQAELGVQHTFKFDATYGEKSTQKRIFDESVKPLIKSCVDGYNATVLAVRFFT